MSITAEPSADGSTLTIRVAERFDFNVHAAMRAAYAQGPRYERYVVDLAATTYMDSSALGMLLQLREFAGEARTALCIRNARPPIRAILGVANFERLMLIE